MDPDIASIIGAAAALEISGVPFQGPLAAARVAYKDDEGYILNPGFKDMPESRLDMVVAGTADAVLMVESEAKGAYRRPDAGCSSVRASGNAGRDCWYS